jgi:hypothetical protein
MELRGLSRLYPPGTSPSPLPSHDATGPQGQICTIVVEGNNFGVTSNV